jgi:DNA-binding protein H-NS
MSEQNTKKETYAELKAQAEVLLKRAEEIRKQELAEIIAEINAKIAEYEITPGQLTFGSASNKKKGGTGSKSGAPKYRDPKSGKTWTGKGTKPQWYKDAIASGVKEEDLLIDKR